MDRARTVGGDARDAEWVEVAKGVGFAALMLGALGGCCVGHCMGVGTGEERGACLATPGHVYADGRCIEGRVVDPSEEP